MTKLFKVCLDIEGNDRGLTVTTVAAMNKDEAIEKAIKHIGVMNQNHKERKIIVKGYKEIGEKGCYSGESIPRSWM
jgi:5,10-methylenetetrahydrofolate reductase